MRTTDHRRTRLWSRLRPTASRVRSEDAGFTLVEMLVVVAIASVVFATAFTVITGINRPLSSAAARAASRGEAAAAVEDTLVELRGAAPLGLCMSPEGRVALSSCRVPGEFNPPRSRETRFQNLHSSLSPAPIYTAEGRRSCFWRYKSGTSTASLRPPDQVCIAVSAQGDLSITATPPVAGSTFTNPSWAGTGSSRVLGSTVQGTGTVFRYFGSNGQELPSPVAAGDLWRIAKVEVNFTVTAKHGVRTVTSTISEAVTLRGTRYTDERCWSGGQCA